MFFSKKKKSKTKEVGGSIDYHNLNDWWLNELTEQERKTIREIYNPVSTVPERNYIDEGRIISSTQSKIGFLSCLSTWFNKKEYYDIAKKVLLEGEKYINDSDNILDKHFFYLQGIKIYYKNRENDPNAFKYAKKSKTRIEVILKSREENSNFFIRFIKNYIGIVSVK